MPHAFIAVRTAGETAEELVPVTLVSSTARMAEMILPVAQDLCAAEMVTTSRFSIGPPRTGR